MKIMLIKGGNDWFDASVYALVMLTERDMEELNAEYRIWYSGKADGVQKIGKLYKNFEGWLIENGFARDTTKDELDEYWEK